MNDDVIMFVVEAVAMVAEHGWKLLPQVSVVTHHVRSCDIVTIDSTPLILNLASFYIMNIEHKKNVIG